MSTDNNSSRIVRFGIFEVDLKEGDLRRSGLKVKLQEQPLQVLGVLLEHPGEVVTREELRTKLWPADTFVDFDHGLNAAVRRLRDALGDSADTPRFVETVARRGYRFIFPVQGLAPPRSQPFPIGDNEVPPSPKPWRKTVLLAGLLLLAVGSSWWFLRPELPKPQLTERRLTANPYDAPVTSGVISPDGKYLAFTDKTGLYLRQVDGGETHAVPLQKGFDGKAESWFPDSTHLVVSHVEDPMKPSSLWEIAVMGGTPRKLCDDGAFARVSSDGSKIAFLRSTNEEIWLMQADGGYARRIVSGGENYFGPVAWAPDGMRFAYVRTKVHYGTPRLDRQIEVYDVTNARVELVLPLRGLAEDVGWANAGRLIYSLQEPPPNEDDFNLWSVNLDSRTERPTGSGTRITSGRGPTAGISITRDGRRMALWRRTRQPDVYVAQLEAQGKTLSKPQRLTLDEREDYPWSWTPDSKAVLFTSNRDGTFHIFKQAIDQTQPELLVGGSEDLYMPRLSPDGSTVLYLVTTKMGEPSVNSRLMRIPLAGGPSQFVLEAHGIWNQECARLPSTLCVYSRIEANEQRFFTFDPISGKGTELLAAKMRKEDGDNDHVFAWGLSPDGKYLVTHQFYGPQKVPGLRVLPLAGGSARFIPSSNWAANCGLDWAADSKSVWVVGYTSGTTSQREYMSLILNMDLNGKVRTMLEDYDWEIGPGVPSPDGRRLALFGATYNSNVWLVDSF